MKRHETPVEVASQLAKFAPQTFRRLLDPAVGNGALLFPLIEQQSVSTAEFVVVDIDRSVLNSLKRIRGKEFPEGSQFIASDFLRWSMKPEVGSFDLIVMNPPFAAGKSNLVRLPPGFVNERESFMPLEAAFLCRAIGMLEDNGRLLAILPSSIIMSMGLNWLRSRVFSCGAIRSVHELPPRCFPTVESRMYLLVFDKGRRQKSIELLNHDLFEPDRLKLKVMKYGKPDRLDFGFHFGTQRLQKLCERRRFGWIELGKLVEVFRGRVESPVNTKSVVHTTNYADGFWQGKAIRRADGLHEVFRVQKNDLLIKRVGRGASQSVGLGNDLVGRKCSDCVLLLRPIEQRENMRLLFALKVVTALSWAKPLVERGTGASYISVESLSALKIPLRLDSVYHRQFEIFKSSVKRQDCKAMCDTVASVANKLERLCKPKVAK